MAYHYHHTHEHERTRRSPSPYYDRPLVRRNSKRQRVTIYDDDLHDDYPSQPSRALTIRPQQPIQVVERYNILNDRTRRHADSEDEDEYYDSDHGRHAYKYTHHTHNYSSSPSSHSAHSYHDSESERDREFRLKIKATIGLPKASALKPSSWPGEIFRRKEKWVDEDWERRDRARVVDDGYWFDEPRVEESTLRVRRIKRTKTEEWKPLRGFRR